MSEILSSTSVLLCGVLLLSTLVPLSRLEHWSVRGFDFPRLQFFAVGLALSVGNVFWLTQVGGGWASLSLVISAGCTLYQFFWILPYTSLYPSESLSARPDAAGQRIRLMTANVLTSNRHSELLIERVRSYQPDMLVTLETDQWWEDQLRPLEAQFPHRIRCPLDNLYGMHLYSRLPLVDAQIRYLVEEDKPSFHVLARMPDGQIVALYFLHPAPPSPTENEASSERDAELVMVARAVSEHHRPVIVTGDLNDVAWSDTTRLFRKISGLLDPRVGRGMFNTFHAWYWFLRWPLDHLFHSQHFRLLRIERLPSIGSDHFPLFTELLLNPNGDREPCESQLEADAEDEKLADEKMEEEGVSSHEVPAPDRAPRRSQRNPDSEQAAERRVN